MPTRPRRFLTVVLLCVSFRALAAPDPAEPVELKPRWELGKRYRLKMESIQDVVLAAAEGGEQAGQKGVQSFEFAVDVREGQHGEPQTLDLTYGRFTMTSHGPGTSLAFDSAAPTNLAAASPLNVLRNLVGARLTLHVDAAGRIENVEGVEEFVRRITDGNPVAKALVENLVSEKAMQQQFGGAFGGNWQPRGAVKPGDAWSVDEAVTFAQFGSMQIRSDYRFDGWRTNNDARCAAIAFTGRIDSPPGKAVDIAGIRMGVTLQSGRISGTTLFDPARSATVETVTRFEGTLTIDLQQNGGEGQGGAFTQKLNQTSTLRLLGIEALPPASDDGAGK